MAILKIKRDNWDKVFPVGAVYMNIDGTNPSTLFGGTWKQVEGRYILAADSSHPADGTGGSSTLAFKHTHTISEHVHTTNGHALVAKEIPKHNHTLVYWPDYDASSDSTSKPKGELGTGTGSAAPYKFSASQNACGSNIRTSNAYGQNNFPDMTAAKHTHGNTGKPTAAETTSEATYAPPYYAVCVWVRTA